MSAPSPRLGAKRRDPETDWGRSALAEGACATLFEVTVFPRVLMEQGHKLQNDAIVTVTPRFTG